MNWKPNTIANNAPVPLGGRSPSRRIAMGVTDANSDAKKTPIIAGFFPNRFEIAGARPTPAKAANSAAAARYDIWAGVSSQKYAER
jgi:hypothetical protein